MIPAKFYRDLGLIMWAVGLALTMQGQTWNEIQKIVASDRGVSQRFSKSVAISGDYAIVGAHRNATDAEGNAPLEKAGAAYIFRRNADSGQWQEVQKIVPSDRAAEDNFGTSVAISGDYVVVGAYKRDEGENLHQCGAVYLFEKEEDGHWVEKQKLLASDPDSLDYFGISVGCSQSNLIVGAAYKIDDTTGIIQAGAAYFFERNSDGIWEQTAKVTASDKGNFDLFGYSVAISGNYAVVGAYKQDKNTSGSATLTDAGAAYIFERNGGGQWTEVQKIVASDRSSGDWLGYRVAMDDNHVILGAPQKDSHTGAAYIFEPNVDGYWEETGKAVALDGSPNDEFGIAVAISNHYALVGAKMEDEDENASHTLNNAGAAYIFRDDNAPGWAQSQKLVASDRGIGDWFGFSVAMNGNNAIIGAFGDGENADGGDFLNTAGSAYLFATDGNALSVEPSLPPMTIQLSPNPVEGRLYITPNGLAPFSFRIVDLCGSQLLEQNNLEGGVSVDLSKYPSGVYVIQIIMANRFYLSEKILKL